MREFKFENNTLHISFGEATFNVDPAVCQIAVSDAQKVLNEFNEKLTQGLASVNDVGDTLASMVEHIEKVIGKGKTVKIADGWGKKALTLHDVCDIMIYMRACALEFEKNKDKSYKDYSSYPQNRQECRQNKKK